MAGPTIYQDVADIVQLDGIGQLFAGKKFWVAQRMASRNHLLDEIKANGGEVVALEKKADYMIADHLRKDCPPGSISYEFVLKSIKDGQLRDPADHRAGPLLGEAREPGAVTRPTKGSRAPYTADEDRILYNWVRDCEANGGLSSGNEIYKQLEKKYPRHTWQSWRDRYLKQLRTRPPSAFNIPDNAPPSPPSDNPPVRKQQPAPAASKPAKKKSPKKERTPSPDMVVGEGRFKDAPPNDKYEYTLDQLEATFTSEDWEEIYAHVDTIESAGQLRYDEGWEKWAEHQANQTAEQWRQYYEKVVRPQWMRDPQWKRDQIHKKVEKAHGQKSSSTPNTSQQQPGNDKEEDSEAILAVQNSSSKKLKKPSEAEDELFEEERYNQMLAARRSHDDDAAAYIFFARLQKWPTWDAQPGLNHVQLHEQLMSQWQSLPDAEKALHMAMNEATKKGANAEAAKIASETKLMSSCTAQYESPKIVKEIYESTLKRVREEYAYEEPEQHAQPRPIKRQKTASPVPDRVARHDAHIGTQNEPVDIPSSQSSTSASQLEAYDERARGQIRAEYQQSWDAEKTLLDLVGDEAEVQSIGSDGFLGIDRLPPPPKDIDLSSEDHLPPDTPTPRASRQQRNNFDTQAILASPSQGLGITKLPRPLGYTQELNAQHESRSSSLVPQAHSEASTTQSIEEFRRSLNGENDQIANPPPRLPSFSPNPSETSEDPDPPLDASEFDEFYELFNEKGFSDDFISAALKRTRCRPELAERVLDAWKVGKPLPSARGIWSLADDDVAEHGDGEALEELQRKHTLDGWGGIVERLKFLEGYRSR